MKRLQEERCPRCAAPIPIPAGAVEVLCTYCDNTFPVRQSPLASFEALLGPITAQRPASLQAVRLVKILGVIIGAFSLFLTVAVMLATTAAFQTPAPAASSPVASPPEAPVPPPAPPPSPLRFQDRAMLADVNGDGLLDVIGLSRAEDQGSWIGAYDGRDGSPLWKSQILGAEASGRGAIRGLFGERVISVDTLGKVQAFLVRSGEPAWTALIGSEGSALCVAGEVLVITDKDQDRHALQLLTGKRAELPTDGPCRNVASRREAHTASYQALGARQFRRAGLLGMDGIPGLSITHGVFPDGEAPALLIGIRSSRPGASVKERQASRVARVAAFQNGVTLWSEDVPGIDPSLTDAGGRIPELAAYAAGSFVIPYAMKRHGEPNRATRFDAVTGKRLWDRPLDAKARGSLGTRVTERDFFYSANDALYVYALDTGELRYRIGEED